MRLDVCVTGHGFGHATRAAALAEALVRRLPDAELTVRSDAPARLFPGLRVEPGLPDPGMVQRDGLDVDWAASLAAHEALLARWDGAVADAARVLRGAALVLADAPPLACAAAAAAGVPARVVTNFTWDWICGGPAERDPRWRPVARRYGEAYARAAGAFRLPGHGGFETVERVEDVPLLARRSSLPRREARAALGVPDDGTRLLLVSFGGFGVAAPRASDDWDGWRLAGFGPAPEGLRAPWHRLDEPAPRPHAEAVAAADAVLCKPGYGTFAEIAAHGAAALYVDRPDYREVGPLVAWLRGAARAEELPRADFRAGRWRPALERLMALPPKPAVPADGAERIAERAAELLGG